MSSQTASTSGSQLAIMEAKERQQPSRPPWRQCCAACDHLDDTGLCRQFDDRPPMDFIEQENDCAEFVECIPF